MALKCKYYDDSLCLAGGHEKCTDVYNERNGKCPYYRTSIPEDSEQREFSNRQPLCHYVLSMRK